MSGSSKLALMGVVLALGLAAPAVGQAATFTVNTTADITVVNGCTTTPACSLRDALKAANASTDPESVVAIPPGRYPLTAGQLKVDATGVVRIRGAGARQTIIDAQGKSRVFEFAGESLTASATLEGATVTGGFASTSETSEPGDGGGVLVVSEAPVTFNQVTISGNTAPLNGAGISAPPENVPASPLVIDASTISGNRVTGGVAEGQAGGVYAYGPLTMTNSTVTANSVENPGANQGGGVLVGMSPTQTTGNAVKLLNTTIAGNAVAVGGVGGGFTIDNPTAGVTTGFEARNTIIANNTAGGATNCGTVVTVTSADNLSSDTSCMFADAGSRQNANPLLATLANNGGPTDTMALPTGSPAVDAGTNTGCPATDQRGTARPQGSACDIGAFELVPTPPVAVVPSAGLRLKIKPKPKHPLAGHKVRFLMTLSNAGPNAATGTVIKGTVPALTKKIVGKKVAGKVPCKLAKAKHGKRRFTCRLGTLAAGSKVKLKVVVKPKAPGELRVRARVRSALADPKLTDNKAKAVVKVKPGT